MDVWAGKQLGRRVRRPGTTTGPPAAVPGSGQSVRGGRGGWGVDQSIAELEQALRLYDDTGSAGNGGGKMLPDVSTIRANCEQLRASLTLSK